MKKIVVTGPESTGKSTLSQQLAAHYNTLWCPEYAREYLGTNGNVYSYDDLLTIAKGQAALEDLYIQRAREAGHSFLFIDTDMYVMKTWCEFVYGKCHRYILEQAATRQYDLYLLCDTDLAWTPDILREYPDLESRRTLYKIYRDILVNQPVPWFNINGNHSQRLELSIAAVNKIL